MTKHDESEFETAEARAVASGAIGLLFGPIAARYGDDAWHVAGSIW